MELVGIESMARSVTAEWLGRVGYEEAWKLQRSIFEEVLAGRRENTLLLCEHPDVLTLGRNARDDRNLKHSREYLRRNGYEIFDVDRGGDVTYHGPGQLVGYPIIRLGDFREDLGWYVRSIEEMIIRAIERWGLEGRRKPGMTGVWCGERKICAIGVRASRWTTMHGFALNVTTRLDRFDAIVPCGISEYEVTSLERESGNRPHLIEIAAAVIAEWDGVMGSVKFEE
jgi:lipoyl(octanoyl) transferase